MAVGETGDWAFPPRLRPRQGRLRFDLQGALRSVVLLHASIAPQAFTAQVLGTERIGHGVAIGTDGLIVTIGYLITEAESIWLTSNDGCVVSGHALAYDQASGFGLVAPLGRLDVPAMERGCSATAQVGDSVTVIGHGGIRHALEARITGRREFAGYWEYLLEEALFTAPAHPQWGGTALVDADGRLIGIGSLLVQETDGERATHANMFVPSDLLQPLLENLLAGRPRSVARPWLGLYATAIENVIVVGGLAEGGPAQRAGVEAGDAILEVEGDAVGELAALYRKVWSTGPAGAEVNLTIARNGRTAQVRIISADRNDFLTRPRLH